MLSLLAPWLAIDCTCTSSLFGLLVCVSLISRLQRVMVRGLSRSEMRSKQMLIKRTKKSKNSTYPDHRHQLYYQVGRASSLFIIIATEIPHERGDASYHARMSNTNITDSSSPALTSICSDGDSFAHLPFLLGQATTATTPTTVG